MVSIEVPNSSDSSVASRFTITLLWKREFRNSVTPLPGWRPTFSLNDSSFAISQFKIIMTLVLRFSLLSFKTSGFALCINSLGPKPAIPSILKCLAKLLNALAVWLVQCFFYSSRSFHWFRSFSFSLYFFWTGYLIFGITPGLFLNPSISSISLISFLLCSFTSTWGLTGKLFEPGLLCSTYQSCFPNREHLLSPSHFASALNSGTFLFSIF